MLKSYSLMLNKGRLQNFKIPIFCMFSHFPLSSTILHRNQAEIISVWNESNFHRRPFNTVIYGSNETLSCINWKTSFEFTKLLDITSFCLYLLFHAKKKKLHVSWILLSYTSGNSQKGHITTLTQTPNNKIKWLTILFIL